jgi:hypothetical protein
MFKYALALALFAIEAEAQFIRRGRRTRNSRLSRSGNSARTDDSEYALAHYVPIAYAGT